MTYVSLNDYCKETFGRKLYKLSLDSGCTCPNRDGLLDSRGCIFCSAGGSGDFAADAALSLDRQLEDAMKRVAGKMPVAGRSMSCDNRMPGNDHAPRAEVLEAQKEAPEPQYIAYVQSFTGTYPGKNGFVPDETGASAFDRMWDRYLELIRHPEVAVLSIATRPDCLGPEVLDMLRELRAIKPVWVELGLQTSNEQTADYIRRCYRNEVYEQAVRTLNELDIPVVTHLILGLPGETADDMKASVRYAVACGTWGLKLQLLHVLEGTDLGEQYKAQESGAPFPGARPIRIMSLEEYTDLLCTLLPLVPPDVVIHRLTGDGPKRLLLAPLWSGNKKVVMNTIQNAIRALPEKE